MLPNLLLESQYKGKIIAGVDEVGRGPLAGPVVAGAVIIKPEIHIDGINDSKKLSPKKREELYSLITSNYSFGIGEASVQEIDKLNILEATKLAMHRAVNNLQLAPEVVLVDGNMKFPDERYVSIIKGDTISISIAAASIIAKVHRDRMMQQLGIDYPEYSWERNSGYGSPSHILALKTHGPTVHHRRMFIRNIID